MFRVKKVINENTANDFIKACQDNPTYKKALAIVKKYGYNLDEICCVNSLGKIEFEITTNNSMQPEVIFSESRFSNSKKEFIVRTFGDRFNVSDFEELVSQYNNALKMVKELSKLDLTTLHHE